MALSASEMREISNDNSFESKIGKITEAILTKAQKAAEKGKTSLDYTGHGFGSLATEASYLFLNKPNHEQQAIISQLQSLGYSAKVVKRYHSDQREGTWSTSALEVSW